MNYCDRLLRLNKLPLMMEYEIADIIFLVKSMKYPSNHFSITDFLFFCATSTPSSSFLKLRHSMTKTNIYPKVTSISTAFQDYGILYPLLTLTCLSQLLSQNYDDFSGITLVQTLIQTSMYISLSLSMF